MEVTTKSTPMSLPRAQIARQVLHALKSLEKKKMFAMENMGIEPMTSCKLAEVMLSKRSTPELIPHPMYNFKF